MSDTCMASDGTFADVGLEVDEFANLSTDFDGAILL
jgi:hypothetical protein